MLFSVFSEIFVCTSAFFVFKLFISPLRIFKNKNEFVAKMKVSIFKRHLPNTLKTLGPSVSTKCSNLGKANGVSELMETEIS